MSICRTPSSSTARKMKPIETNYQSGTLWKYTQTVGDARYGAVTHPGGKAETHVYADL